MTPGALVHVGRPHSLHNRGGRSSNRHWNECWFFGNTGATTSFGLCAWAWKRSARWSTTDFGEVGARQGHLHDARNPRELLHHILFAVLRRGSVLSTTNMASNRRATPQCQPLGASEPDPLRWQAPARPPSVGSSTPSRR